MAISTALLGTGIFARDVYSRVLADRTKAGSVKLKQVWSRSAEAAKEYVTKFAPYSEAISGVEGLAKVLSDPEIQLVVVVLPPDIALPVIRQALRAGKHVIEEKPVAATLDLALAALQEYRKMAKRPLWMLSENYRYEDVFLEACRMAPQVLGDVVKLDLVAEMQMDATNKYYGSQWRRSVDGLALMESSVHFVAALRMLAAACGLGEAAEVSARTHHAKPDLSPPDTIVGTVGFDKGSAPATVSITLAASQLNWSLKAVGTTGVLEVTRGGWTGSRAGYTLTWKKTADEKTQSRAFPFTGVDNAFSAFTSLVEETNVKDFDQVQASTEASRASAEEGARDLALVEALLRSGASGGSTIKVAHVA